MRTAPGDLAAPGAPAHDEPDARPPVTGVPRSPDDVEKYSYVQRDLPYLATILVIGGACLVVSQLRFELHAPSGWVS